MLLKLEIVSNVMKIQDLILPDREIWAILVLDDVKL